MKNKSSVFLLLLSFVGFFDSVYLTILHYKNIVPPCSLLHGCERVLNSQFSVIFGVPVALLGSLYFVVLIFLILNPKFFRYFKILAFLGVIASAIFFSIQAFVLKAFCQYCLLSEAIILAIFILSFIFKEKSEAQTGGTAWNGHENA